ncbi:hypothetical protein C1Y63_10600 [Corynebacterium sp. 13CS0277]|uniref:hypothetical protein n=1 Tax=Corynebacterium sp. 13CS0277 TaxID=2071994 RepID=UPI000D031C0D|nr:hypothetical protein [Corynebacterium sp. 13CS0277]PRQ10635.1 hypothetical protein C1Y63_10600 [Corynebacterium sp. 13CS0277]
MQRFYGLDLRDCYKPGGGPGRLTLRRIIVLLKGLRHEESLFWCAVADMDVITPLERLVADVYGVVSGNRHPVYTRREDLAKRQERERKKQKALRAIRARKRAQRKQ